MQQPHADCLGNGSTVTEFLLLGFQVAPILKPFFFMLFLTIYIVTVAGNGLIVTIVCSHEHLQTPMYFFLVALSFLEIWYTTSIFPTMLGSLLLGKMGIPFSGCVAQFYFIALFACNESLLLTLMAYDRYVAICYPLHYTTIMDLRLRVRLIAGAWVTSCAYSFGGCFLTFSLEFSGPNEIDHFFCDFAPLLNVACSDVTLVRTEFFVTALIVTSVPLTLIIVSYAFIISTILRMPSATGRQKAFSTCSSHLIVVITYFGTLIIVYGTPKNAYSLSMSKVLSLAYTVATPLLNPIIYTLRNKDIRETLNKILKNKCG